MHRHPLCLVAAIVFFIGQQATASSVALNPSKDNTLIQGTTPASQLSNGQGDIFVGRTAQDGSGTTTATISIRRGLVAFDIAGSVPAGATITGATLTLRDVMGLNGDPTVELHRVTKDWGEGASFQNGGMGAAAENGDATWLYTFFNKANPTSSTAWTNPGGDFSSTVSATAVVSDDLGAFQFFSWSSAQMVADVQGWLNNPSTNFGWLLKHTDETIGQTAKRLNSGESAFPPVLTLTYTVPEPSTLAMCACAAVGLSVVRFGRRRRS
jgi:hypothetical protein